MKDFELDKKYSKFIHKVKIKEEKPLILDSDYNIGFITRYFAKDIRITSVKIIEITNNVYKNLSGLNPRYPYERYKIIKLDWKIKGDLATTKNANHITTDGVIDINTDTIKKANKILSGLDKKLYDYKQFWRSSK